MPRFNSAHVALITIAVATGIIIDRGFLPKPNRALSTQTRIESVKPVAPAAARIEPASNGVVGSSKGQPAKSSVAPRKSLDVILAERDPRLRTTDLEEFINNLGPRDYGEALKRIRKIPGNNDRELASRLLVSRWVQSDPEAALQFAASNRGYEYIADNVFEQSAALDVQAALERAKSLPNADLRYNALRGVLSFIADSDPTGALGLAQTFGDFPGNEPLSSVIYRQWAANDPQAAALQATQDPAGGWRSPVGQVVRTWAQQDPAAAANWSLSLADAEAQSRSISQVMRQWSREDLTAAANWINSLPPGASHDTAVAALAYSIAAIDPQNAISWIGSITDETARNTALQRISREVMWRDPANGSAILQAAGVPANFIVPPDRRRAGGH